MKRLLTHSHTEKGGGGKSEISSACDHHYCEHKFSSGYLSGENTMESLFKFLQWEAKTTKCDVLHSSSDLFLRMVKNKYRKSYISSERKSTL